MSSPTSSDLDVRYSRVSLAAWILVCVLLIAISSGMALSSDSDLGQRATGVIVGPLALTNLAYLVSRLVARQPRYVIGSAGLEDRRAFQRVFVPWSSVRGVSIGRPLRGRRCIFLTLMDGAEVEGSWPWWMRGWGWQPGEVRISDWLVLTSLDEMAAAIESSVN